MNIFVILMLLGIIGIIFAIVQFIREQDGIILINGCLLGMVAIGSGIWGMVIDFQNKEAVAELKQEIRQKVELNEDNEDSKYELLSEKLGVSKDDITLEDDGNNTYYVKTSIGDYMVQYDSEVSEIKKLFTLIEDTEK